MKSFWRSIPVKFFLECISIKPSRETEAMALFNLYTIYLLDRRILNGSVYYNDEEQKVVDVEIQLMQFGLDGLDVRKKISEICDFTLEKINQLLDKAEAKCYIRNLRNLEPIPPRKHRFFKINLETLDNCNII